MAGTGGRRPGAGRPRGKLNKATEERLLQVGRDVDRARRGEIELAKDVLDRMMKLCEGAAGVHRPITEADVLAGRAQMVGGDWGQFGEWVDRTVYCAKELAKYQSPTFKAIAVHTPGMGQAPKQIEAEVIDLKDPHVLNRTYLRMVKESKALALPAPNRDKAS